MEMKVEPNHFEDERSDYKTAASENKMVDVEQAVEYVAKPINPRRSIDQQSILSQIS